MDISWVACAIAKGASMKENLKAAMRLAVDDQIMAFKKTFRAGAACAVCEKTISGKFHADHFIHFDTLYRNFLEAFPKHPEKFDDDPVKHRAKFKTKDSQFEKKIGKIFMKRKQSFGLLIQSVIFGDQKPKRPLFEGASSG